MKALLSTILSLSLITQNTFAASSATTTEAQQIAKAAKLLSEIAENSNTAKVKPGDAKAMLLEYALQEQIAESEADFEANWQGNNGNAWGADSMSWGTDSLSGAEHYILTNIQDRLDIGDKTDADKIKYADDMTKAKRAFEILRSVKSVQFGVAPVGAIQCGVTFAALFILDTKTGVMYQITMEGSGC